MKKLTFTLIILLLLNYGIHSDEINFPPELSWWIAEMRKVNLNIDVNQFELGNKEIRAFVSDNHFEYKLLLTYPVFMRWNYSGNYVAYYNYHSAPLGRQPSGKYRVYGGDDVAFLFIANRNKTIFFADDFGISEGLNAIAWLTDTVLIGVGISINEKTITVFIKKYTINNNEKNVEIITYFYENACTINDWHLLKLNWYEQRYDYFEIDK